MTKAEIEKMIIKCQDEAKHHYKNGSIKEGRKAEKNIIFFKSLLNYYEKN